MRSLTSSCVAEPSVYLEWGVVAYLGSNLMTDGRVFSVHVGLLCASCRVQKSYFGGLRYKQQDLFGLRLALLDKTLGQA